MNNTAKMCPIQMNKVTITMPTNISRKLIVWSSSRSIMSKQSSKSISPSPSSSLRKYWEIRHTIIISEVRRRIKDVDLAMNECTINFVVSSGSSSLLFVKGIIVMQRRNSAVQTAHGNRTESTKEWTVI